MSVVVPAPLEEAWELLCDARRNAEWADSVLAVTRADHPLRLGSTYEERTRVAGPWKESTLWRVTEFDPPQHQRHEGQGIHLVERLAITFDFEPHPQGSRLTLRYYWRTKFGLLGSLIDRALRGTATREQQRSAEGFAAVVAGDAAQQQEGAAGTSTGQ